MLASQPVLVRKSEPQFCTFDRWSLVRTLITIFWDMAVFFRLMLLMLLTFVFAFLLLPGQEHFLHPIFDANKEKL